jgi:formylglycine-generating enzyme required for sulfatase activity
MHRAGIPLAIIISLLFSISTVFAADTPPVKLKLREPVKPTKENVKTVSDPITGMQFVFVKGGCYQMGSDKYRISPYKPVHQVCLSDFYMGKYEVTQSQWEKVMGNNPSEFKKCGPDCPVENVSWNDAHGFIKKLNTQSGKQYRLPTEAEWEYAASSGGKDEIWAGTSDKSALSRYAWYDTNSGKSTHKVGLKKSNGLGLYDMSGNVMEWCQDWYNEAYYEDSPKDNPSGPDNGEKRVNRGGGWLFPDELSGIRPRYSDDSGDKSPTTGLRLLLPAQ